METTFTSRMNSRTFGQHNGKAHAHTHTHTHTLTHPYLCVRILPVNVVSTQTTALTP